MPTSHRVDKTASNRLTTRTPRTYKDLTDSHIRLLTSVLHTSSHASEEQYQQQLSELPSHLRTQLRLLSKLCSKHNRLNPLPLIDLLKAIRFEVEVNLLQIWAPLVQQSLLNTVQCNMIQLVEDVAALWWPHDTYLAVSRRLPERKWSEQTNGCAACSLSRIGGDVEVCIALGALMLGRMNKSIWNRSKRIKWLEDCIRNAAPDGKAAEAIKVMWSLGLDLKLLSRAQRERPSGEAQARQNLQQHTPITRPQTPARPPRSSYQSDHVAITRSKLCGKSSQQV